jgi:hypothetical protein
VLLIILATCFNQSEQHVKELKQCIPDLKKLVSDNEEIFTEIRALSKRKSETARFEVVRDPTKNDAIIVIEYDGDHVVKQEKHLYDYAMLTNEEKDLIRSLFFVSENEVRVYCVGPGGDWFDVDPYKNLVRMELIYGEGNTIAIEEIKGYSAYWEEILDNWYVFIIVSKPN